MFPSISRLFDLGRRVGVRHLARSFNHSTHRQFHHKIHTRVRQQTTSPSSQGSSQASYGWMIACGSSILLIDSIRRYVSGVDSVAAAEAESDSTTSHPPPPSHIWNPPPLAPHDQWAWNWDGLQDVPVHIDPKSGRPVHVTRHLIFIRHGQYVVPEKWEEDTDPVLTPLGREQANLAGARLKSLGYPISVIHASTMSRAFETASLIGTHFPEVPILPTDLLREGVPCLHAPLHATWHPSLKEIAEEPLRIDEGFNKIVKRWRQDEQGLQIQTCEEWCRQKEIKTSKTIQTEKLNEKGAPVTTAGVASTPLTSTSAGTISLTDHSGSNLKPIEVDRYELVVCHGNVIRYMLLRALQLPPQAWLRIAIYNTGMSHITIRSHGTVGIRTLGETGHLTKEQITYF